MIQNLRVKSPKCWYSFFFKKRWKKVLRQNVKKIKLIGECYTMPVYILQWAGTLFFQSEAWVL